MASILRVRDENGNIIDIPALKGEKGDSYVLTEADKSSIKDLVVSEIDVPTKTSQLENNSGFITAEDIPDNGLTQEQLADLKANTEARHTHENKGVLDGFDIKNNEDEHIYYRNHYVWTADAGSVIARVETTTSGDLNIILTTNYRETETLTIKTPPTKLSQLENDSGYPTAEYIDNAISEINTRIDEIVGGIDEIEAMIDESGVLDE
jgi:hypothetical protein